MDSINRRDIHVLKYFSSFVSVSNGQIINITEPALTFCPLAKHLYKDFSGIGGNDKKAIKSAIKSVIELKIKDYGFFTGERKLLCGDVSIPYGASEMLSFALRKGVIDAAVVVCEGAGTVITDTSEVVQGIGARMHNLIMTSPIAETIRRLTSLGCHMVSNSAMIDQFLGVRKAAEMGYKTIAVTIDGHSADNLEKLKDIEKYYGVKVISLVVCTTGIKQETVGKISRYGDLVWSCSSVEIRKEVGPLAKLQLSELMPVFVISEAGVGFAAGYCADPLQFISGIDKKRQYLISSRKQGKHISMDNFTAYIEESQLPVLSPKFPVKTNLEENLAIAN